MVAEVENMLPLSTAMDRTRCYFSPFDENSASPSQNPHFRPMRYRAFSTLQRLRGLCAPLSGAPLQASLGLPPTTANIIRFRRSSIGRGPSSIAQRRRRDDLPELPLAAECMLCRSPLAFSDLLPSSSVLSLPRRAEMPCTGRSTDACCVPVWWESASQ
jgi:hypothetical protein